jgi:DNA-binding response OmpR family regulator
VNTLPRALAVSRPKPAVTTLLLVVPDKDLARCMSVLRHAGFEATTAAMLDSASEPPASAETRESAHLSFGDVTVDVRARQVRRGGFPVRLTPVEFDILLALLRHRGQVVTKRELHPGGWSLRKGALSRRVLATHILNLRHKLEPDPANPRHILTVWGIGYRMETGI